MITMTKTIQSLAEIPFDEGLIVSGSVNKTCWVWRMPGEFKGNNPWVWAIEFMRTEVSV